MKSIRQSKRKVNPQQAMKSIRQREQKVNPPTGGGKKEERRKEQATQWLDFSPIAEWNALFPENPITELEVSNAESAESIDLIPPRNSSSGEGGVAGELFPLPFGEQGGISSGTEVEGGELPLATQGVLQGDISSRTGEGEESDGDSQGGNSSRSGFVVPSWSEEELRQFAEEWGIAFGNVEAAYKKLMKYPECGKHGGVMVGYDYRKEEVVDLILNPISCNSVHCRYCQWRHSRSRLSEVVSYFARELEEGRQLTFITLTVRSTHDIGEAVRLSKRLMERFYQLRFRGKVIQRKLRALFIEELAGFTVSLFGELLDGDERDACVKELVPLMEEYVEIAEKRSPNEFKELKSAFFKALLASSLSRFSSLSDWYARVERVFRQLYFYSDFCSRLSGISPDVKLGQYLSAVWKFELTYSPEHGYHPHWHGITNFLVPKLYLTAICRYVGFGSVNDVRLVRGFKGLVELAKYEAKPWELPMDDPVEVLKREAFLHGFKKLRVWNLEPNEEQRELPDVLYFAIPRSVCSYSLLEGRFRALPSVYRELKVEALKKRGGDLRKRFGRVKITATLGVGLAWAYSDVYLGLDGDLHVPLDGRGYLEKERITLKDLAHKVLKEYEFFLLRVVGYSLKDLVEKRLERLGGGTGCSEKNNGQPVSSSFSRSHSLVYEARELLIEFIEEFQRYAGVLSRRYASYKDEIDALFELPSYWLDDGASLSEVGEFLMEYGDRVRAMLERLENVDGRDVSEVYSNLSYLIGRIESELDAIFENLM